MTRQNSSQLHQFQVRTSIRSTLYVCWECDCGLLHATMYGALPPTPEGAEPEPVSRRPTARSVALAGVGAALLFAAATLAGGASAPSPLAEKLDAAATDDRGEMHDDYYNPNVPIHPVDDVDDDAASTIVDDAHATADDVSQAQTAYGDAASPSEWADAEVDIDLRAFKSVRKFLEGRNVTFQSPDSVRCEPAKFQAGNQARHERAPRRRAARGRRRRASGQIAAAPQQLIRRCLRHPKPPSPPRRRSCSTTCPSSRCATTRTA